MLSTCFVWVGYNIFCNGINCGLRTVLPAIHLDNFLVPQYNATVDQRLKEWRRMFWKVTAGCILTGTFLRNTKDHVPVVW